MSIEEKRLELEEKRLSFQEKKYINEDKFFQKHFSVIITALLTLVTIVISGSQVWVAYINKEKELSDIRAKSVRSEKSLKLEQDRRWNLDITRFIFENRKLIYSEDIVEAKYMRNIMLTTFPLEITNRLFLSIEQISGNQKQIKTMWKDGLNIIDNISLSVDKTVEIDNTKLIEESNVITSQYIENLVKQFPNDNRREISNKIARLYNSYSAEVVTGLINGIEPENKRWSYRINIYVARTLALINPSWIGNDRQIKELEKLKNSENYNESAFKSRLDAALKNFKKK